MLTSRTYTVEVAGVTFLDSESAPIPKFLNPGPAIFKFEDPTPVQIPAAITDLTVIYPCFYLGNNHTDSCFCRNWKMTPDRGPVIHNFWLRTQILARNKNTEFCQIRLRLSGSGVKQNFWHAKFLTSHHVRMHRVMFYIPKTLTKLITRL